MPPRIGSLSFHPWRLPATKSSAIFSAALLVTAITLAVMCITLPPVFDVMNVHTTAVSSIQWFALNDPVNIGSYSNTPRLGDTNPSLAATFYSVSALGKDALTNKNDTIKYAEKYARSGKANGIAEDMYQLSSLLFALDLLTDDLRTTFLDDVNNLRHEDGGFRTDSSTEEPSLSGTYHAFKTLDLLTVASSNDHFTPDQKKEMFAYVSGMQRKEDGGFAEKAGANSTVTATYQALDMLESLDSVDVDAIVKYIISTQAADGGHSDIALDVDDRHRHVSSVAITGKALAVTFRVAPDNKDLVSRASTYIAASVASYGIRTTSESTMADIEATHFAFPLLMKMAPADIHVRGVLFALAIVLGSCGALMWYRDQLGKVLGPRVQRQVFISLALLVAGGVAVQFYTTIAVVVYLFLGIYFTISFYQLTENDTDDEMLLVAMINSFLSVGIVVWLEARNHSLFAQLTIFQVLVVWSSLSSVVTVLGSSFLVQKNSLVFYVNAAFLTWLMNTIFLAIFVYVKSEITVVMRLVQLKGLFPSICVAYPFATLALILLSSCVAFSFTTPVKGGGGSAGGGRKRTKKNQ
eukprot:TRINITY_DN6412_c0_g2_i1.p1 TRINITY_DN6412_c0_g2~~TRINITY_DN6412_c0_g2_i1.p1  ORF type:complete len:580 (+),score=144.11 TRINITY_DN6412_c0_g2_i1:231-1970(+)